MVELYNNPFLLPAKQNKIHLVMVPFPSIQKWSCFNKFTFCQRLSSGFFNTTIALILSVRVRLSMTMVNPNDLILVSIIFGCTYVVHERLLARMLCHRPSVECIGSDPQHQDGELILEVLQDVLPIGLANSLSYLMKSRFSGKGNPELSHTSLNSIITTDTVEGIDLESFPILLPMDN
uniref:Uncharacterized protein n=1 Tax=Solanum lycopersicum TaxID=4081 RepID=A0A3Q7H3W3_SOLLC